MSKFYGTVVGASSTNATRRGHDSIKTAAQSYDGSVIVRLNYSEAGKLMVDLQMSEGSSTLGHTEFYGTFDDLKKKLRGEL